MISQPLTIPWVNLEQIITLYNEKITKLVAAKDVLPLSFCEGGLPELFSKLHDIVRPALV